MRLLQMRWNGMRRSLRSASGALATTDGRWALVSTTITGLVAGTMAWLAATAMPPLHPKTQEATATFLPYRLFSELVSASSNLLGSRGEKEAAIQPPAPLDQNLADENAADDETPGVETRTLTLDSGDTLAGVLNDAGVPGGDVSAAIAALDKVFDLRNARAGQSFTVTFESAPENATAPATPAGQPAANSDDSGGIVIPVATTSLGRLLSITFSPSVEHDVTVTRQPDSSYTAADTIKKLVEHTHRVGGKIDSSLYLAATQAGIPTDVTVAMIKMFSYKVDFQRDLRPGDSFEVYYSYYYTPDGQAAREGDIDYAMMRTGGHEYAVYRYQPDPKQAPEYFDANGESLRGMLMKTPVDGARISSGFGMRYHPVLGYTRMHKGIDFAVPVGTPVMAAGTGTVVIAGHVGGYGNFVKIDMGNGWGTGYGHLSRFAPGIHPGSRVRQGQIIAYSGNTGITTGPHLHYEIFQHGTQVNPLKVKVAQGRKLAGKELRDFKAVRLKTDETLVRTALETKTNDATADLRTAKAH
ncbi:MAG: peptidoglycan DD-metalloendopeptidase family protein [Proteobacteria bacterium]|nr:peptidoglycan DD-metalloendopeptidase family protein [Pseudomonadota bacterium]